MVLGTRFLVWDVCYHSWWQSMWKKFLEVVAIKSWSQEHLSVKLNCKPPSSPIRTNCGSILSLFLLYSARDNILEGGTLRRRYPCEDYDRRRRKVVYPIKLHCNHWQQYKASETYEDMQKWMAKSLGSWTEREVLLTKIYRRSSLKRMALIKPERLRLEVEENGYHILLDCMAQSLGWEDAVWALKFWTQLLPLAVCSNSKILIPAVT